MVIKRETIEEKCQYCGRGPITLREYVGLEGAWYTDHQCTFPPSETYYDEIVDIK